MSCSVKLINLKKVIERKGIDFKQIADVLGIAHNVASRYINGQKCNIERARKISEFVGVDLNILSGNTFTEQKINYTTPCYNQSCPLNKDCICINDVVLSGKAGCDGKYLVKDKPKRQNYRSTKGVVVHSKRNCRKEDKYEI